MNRKEEREPENESPDLAGDGRGRVTKETRVEEAEKAMKVIDANTKSTTKTQVDLKRNK